MRCPFSVPPFYALVLCPGAGCLVMPLEEGAPEAAEVFDDFLVGGSVDPFVVAEWFAGFEVFLGDCFEFLDHAGVYDEGGDLKVEGEGAGVHVGGADEGEFVVHDHVFGVEDGGAGVLLDGDAGAE